MSAIETIGKRPEHRANRLAESPQREPEGEKPHTERSRCSGHRHPGHVRRGGGKPSARGRVVRQRAAPRPWATAALMTPVPSQAQLFTLTKEQMIEFTAQNPFERFPDGRPKVPDALSSGPRLVGGRGVGVLPGKGFRNQYADGFQMLHPGRSWWAAP